MSDFVLLKNNDVSHLEFSKFQEYKALFSLSNQALGACLSPYSALISLHMWFGLFLSSKPSCCGIYTASVNSPLKNTLLISTCLSFQSLFAVKVRTILIVVALTTGLNVYLKSTPGVCRNPFAISLALNLLMVPSGFSLTLYTHFFPTNL